MIKKIIIFLIFFVILFSPFTKVAFAVFALEITQIFNYLQSIFQLIRQTTMVINQAKQIQNQIQQLKSVQVFSNGQWSSAIGLLNQLQGVVQQGQAISYATQNIAQVFQQKYPGYVSSQNYTADYQTWANTTLDSIKGALMSVGLQSNSFATENTTLTALRNLSDGAVGQTQAIQVGNMINNEMIAQLQKLRQLQMSQAQSQNAYMAHRINKEAADEATLGEIFQDPGSNIQGNETPFNNWAW